MDAFEYVMVLVSIVVGLGVTHILSAMGAAVHRLRGTGEPIRLHLAYVAWVASIFLWLVSFWWWEFKLAETVTEWTFGFYLFVVGYAVSLFLLAVILVPRDMDDVSDSREHFMSIRGWFLGLFILGNAIDLADTFLKGYDWGVRPVYLVYVAFNIVAAAVAIRARSWTVQTVIAVVLLAWQLGFTFAELDVLGGW